MRSLASLLAELRTAETPIASTVHEPFGSPAGPGLFHVKGLQLPAYIQHVAHHLVAEHGESGAIKMAVGIIRNWAAGHDGHGNKVHPDVQAAAAKALAQWEAAKAAAHASGGKNRSAPVTELEHRAPMTSASINDLPDSAFAYIEPGGSKDAGGKTIPRSLRHFPVHDKAHAANALSRAPQSPFGDKAMPKIKAAAKKFGIQVGGDDSGRSAGKSPGGGWDQYEIERRFTPVATELRASPEGQKIAGYAAVFGQPSRNLGGFIEMVGAGAFNQARSLGWPNCVCRYNHDPNMVLGTTAGRTLSMQIDNTGLDYEVLPPQARADILELVQRGDVQHSSFAFRVPAGGDEWTTTRDTNYPLRTLHEVQLVDVAPVLDPAYPDATAGLRSLARQMGAELDEVRSMAEHDELRRFFARTDRPSYQKPKPKISGPQAMMRLMEKRFPQV